MHIKREKALKFHVWIVRILGGEVYYHKYLKHLSQHAYQMRVKS